MLDFNISMNFMRLRDLSLRLLRSVVRWIVQHMHHGEVLLSNLDAQQEALLSEEISKLQSDTKLTEEVRRLSNMLDTLLWFDAVISFFVFICMRQMESLMQELSKALDEDLQLSAERNFLEGKVGASARGSDDMVKYSEWLLRIKQKQLQLNVSVIDSIKGGLEERFSKEDGVTISVAGFPDDSPELSIEEMPAKIKADLVNSFKPKAHITVEDFVQVVLFQPWQAEEAVLDVRLEEKISEVDLAVDTLVTEARLLEEVVSAAESQIKAAEEAIVDLNIEIDNLKNGGKIEGELSEEMALELFEKVR
jgi:hypothetical protein